MSVFDFVRRARSKDDAVGLKALSITAPEFTLGISIFIDQKASQAKASRTTLAKALFDEVALSGKKKICRSFGVMSLPKSLINRLII